MNKKPIALLLSAATGIMQVMPAASAMVYAEENQKPTVYLESETGRPGDTVSLNLYLKGNTGLNAMAVWLKYDSDALECIDIEDAKSFGTDAFDPPSSLSKNPVRLGWTNNDSQNTKDGLIASVDFKIKDAAYNGVYDIEISTVDGNNFKADLSDETAFDDVELAFENGRITVKDGKSPMNNPTASETSIGSSLIYDVEPDSFKLNIPSGTEYTYSDSEIKKFRKCKWYSKGKVTELKPNTTYYVYTRTSKDDTPKVESVTTSKYKITDVIESISVGSNGSAGTLLTPEIKYKDGFDADSLGEITYCWSAKDWTEPSVSMAKSYMITSEDAAGAREISVTIAGLNCSGIMTSNSLNAGKSDYTGEVSSPVIKEKNADGFIVSAMPGYEYTVSENSSIAENAVWSDLESDAAVSGKTVNKKYYVFARVKASAAVNSSEPSAPVSVRIPNNDASLAKIILSSGKVTPDFDPEITEYEAVIPDGRGLPAVKAVMSDSNAEAEVKQAKRFTEGKNKSVITVKAENGIDEKVYTVAFTEMTNEAASDPASSPEDKDSSSSDAPYIKGNADISGWDAICSEISNSSEGETITVKMNGTTDLPIAAASALQYKNTNLVLDMGMGIKWKINGLNVTEPKDADMQVSELSRKYLADMADDLGSEKRVVQLKLHQDGNYGFNGILIIDLNERYNDYYASLYSYNKKDESREFKGSCYVSDEKALFEITDAAEYAIVFTREPISEDVSAKAGVSDVASPIAGIPVTNGVQIPSAMLPHGLQISNKKRRYRILRKRKLDDMVFVY